MSHGDELLISSHYVNLEIYDCFIHIIDKDNKKNHLLSIVNLLCIFSNRDTQKSFLSVFIPVEFGFLSWSLLSVNGKEIRAKSNI